MLESIYTLVSKAQALQSPKRLRTYPIENLVLEGGGIKGLVYAGALSELAEEGLLDKVKRVAGSSAGGIISLLMASGFSPSEIQKIMTEEINFKELMDSRNSVDPTRVFKAAGMPIGLTDIVMLFQHKGLYQGEKFLSVIKEIIGRKIEEKIKTQIRQTHQNEIENLDTEEEIVQFVDKKYQEVLDKYYINDPALITFEQLDKLSRDFPGFKFKELYLTGTRVRDGKLRVFSAKTTPNMPVVLATRITMSFPFGFEPVLYEGELHIDGGVADNYPMSIFDSPEFLSHGRNEANVNPCTLGLLVDSKGEIEERWGVKREEIKNTLSVAGLIEGVLKGLQVRSEVLNQFYSTNSLQIYDEDIETMDLNLDENKIKKLILSGRKAMREYLDNYRSQDAAYQILPDYQNIKEKLYAKTPQEIRYALEKEVIPLFEEVVTLKKALQDIDINQELTNLQKLMATLDQAELDKQEELYQILSDMANQGEALEKELVVIKKELQVLQSQKTAMLHRINLLEQENTDNDQIAALYERIKDFNDEIFIKEENQKKLQTKLTVHKEKSDNLISGVNKAIFAVLSQRAFLNSIQENALIAWLENVDEILNEQVDEMLGILHSSGMHYPDPRTSSRFEQQLFKQRERKKQEIEKLYQKQHFYTAERAKEVAQVYDAIFEDILSFGISFNAAQVHAQYYLSARSLFESREEELRTRLFKNLLVDKLIELNIVKEKDEQAILWFKDNWEKHLGEILQRDSAIPRGYAELLAKEYVIKEWAALNKKESRPAPLHSEFYYTSHLRDLTKEIGEGVWSGTLIFTNRFDVIHNLEQAYKHATSYQMNTSVFDSPHTISYLSFTNEVSAPPIKMHVLTPQHSNQERADEIVVLFEQPGQRDKESQFALASKFAKKREDQFLYHRENILKQIRFALLKIQEQGGPRSGKVRLTIQGEGLGGLDAQMLLLTIFQEINAAEKNDILQFLSGVDVQLIDPNRVSTKTAEKARDELAILKAKKSRFTCNGYNLIHQKSYAGVIKKRKPRNYLGETNLLSVLPLEHAKINAEFRDLYDEQSLNKICNNQNADKLKKSLNKSSFLFGTNLYRQLSLGYKRLKVLSRGVFVEALPMLTQFLLRLPLQVGKGLIRRTSSPLYRLYRLFKKSKSSLSTQMSWHTKSSLATESAKASWQEKAESLIDKVKSEQRLREESKPPIENLVFAGGMGKGIIYAGALSSMQNNGLLTQVKRISGSSEGGLVGALFALGFTAEELIQLMTHEFNDKLLQDEVVSLGGLDKLFTIQGVDVTLLGLFSSLENKGLYKGEVFESLLQKLIRFKLEQKLKSLFFDKLTPLELQQLTASSGGMTASDRNEKIEAYLQNKLNALKEYYAISDLGQITFGQLKTLSQDFPTLELKDIYLTGTRLRDAQLKVFSHEHEPDMPLFRAIRITNSTPGKYVPVTYDNENYVSGNIANDYPIEMFDQPQYLSHGINEAGVNPCSFGLMVNEEAYCARWGLKPPVEESLTLSKLLGNVLKGMYSRASTIASKYEVNTLIFPEQFKKSSELKRLLFFGKKFTKEELDSLIDVGLELAENYHADYGGEEVLYAKKQYQTIEQKYFAKTPVELERILQKEILPHQQEIDLILSEAGNSLLLKQEFERLAQELKGSEHIEEALQKKAAISHEFNLIEEKIKQKGEDSNAFNQLQQRKIDLERERINIKFDEEISPELISRIQKKIAIEEKLMLIEMLENAKEFLKEEERAVVKSLELKGIHYKKDKRQVAEEEKSVSLLADLPFSSHKQKRRQVSESIAPSLSVKIQQEETKAAYTKFKESKRDIFSSRDWQCYVADNISTYVHKENAQYKVQIAEDKEKLSFSGQPVSKIAVLANAYEKSIKNQDRVLDYEIKAQSLDEIYIFLRELSANGFEINKINKMSIQNNSIKIDCQKVIAEVEQQMYEKLHQSRNLRRMKPPTPLKEE